MFLEGLMKPLEEIEKEFTKKTPFRVLYEFKEDFTARIQAGGQPKAFQIYNGHTAVATFNVLTAGGDTVLIPQVPAGTILPLAVVRVWSVGTTAAALGSTIAFT